MNDSRRQPTTRLSSAPPCLRGCLSACALALALAALAALAPAPAAADIVYLDDGTTVEGEVTDLGDRIVVRKTSGISVSYDKWRVTRIERRASAAEEYRKRKEAVGWDDARGLLGLARWCMKKGLRTEAERAYRDVLWIASPVYREAKRELAEFLEKGGRLKEALALYVELGGGAAGRARAVRRKLDERRTDVYRKGSRELTEGKYREALVTLERAYNLAPPGTSAKPGVVDEADIVAMLVSARGLHAESFKDARVSLSNCSTCGAGSTVLCHTCRGRGKVLREVWNMTSDGMRRERKLLTCDTCRGAKIVRCSKCSGASVELGGLPSRVKGTLRSLAERAFGSVASAPDRAIQRLSRWVVSHPLAFAGGEPSYARSKDLRGTFKAVPPSATELGALAAAWRGADAQARGNFLACYCLELAKCLSLVPPSARDVDVREDHGSDAAALASAETGDASVVSAFPAKYSGGALRIVGIWKGAKDGAGGAPRADIDFEAAGPTNLHPFVWKQAARSVHKRVGDALGLKGMSSRAAAYPYEDLERAAAAHESGDRVELLGRMYYDGTPVPDWRFEVWRIALRPDEETERALAALSRRVTFRFQDTPLEAAMEMLADLTGLGVDLDVPKGLEFAVSARARRAPLGRALSGLLRPLELHWIFTGGRVRITSRVSTEDRARVDMILKLLPPSAGAAK